MQRVGPDLHFDPLRAQRLERLVLSVQPNHVCLPSVRVALVGGREVDAIPQPLRVSVRDSRPVRLGSPTVRDALARRARIRRRYASGFLTPIARFASALILRCPEGHPYDVSALFGSPAIAYALRRTTS